MPPDFVPHGPGYWPGLHHHGGPWVPPDGGDAWPVLAGLLLVLTVLATLWAAGYLPVPRRPRPPAEPAASARADWAAALARHRAVAEAFARFECDPQAALETPALADVRRPPTARFVEAFAEAGALCTETFPGASFADRFVRAVEHEDRAWTAAVEAAQRARDAVFDRDERAALDRVRRLLDIIGSSPYEHERHAALQQARRRLGELERRTGWRLPVPATRALEQRARGALIAGG